MRSRGCTSFPSDWVASSEISSGATAREEGTTLNHCQAFRTENGSSQGHHLALTVSFVPSSLESGWGVPVRPKTRRRFQSCQAAPPPASRSAQDELISTLVMHLLTPAQPPCANISTSVSHSGANPHNMVDYDPFIKN